MTRRRRRTACALDFLEARLSLSHASAPIAAPVVVAFAPTSDLVVYGRVDPGDTSPDPADGPGLPDPTDPDSNDGQLPILPLDPAPLNPAGPY